MGNGRSKTSIIKKKNSFESEKKYIEVSETLINESITDIEKKIKTQNIYLQFKNLESHLRKNKKLGRIYHNLDKIYKIIEILDNNNCIQDKKYSQLTFKDLFFIDMSTFSEIVHIIDLNKYIFYIKFTLENYINNNKLPSDDDIVKFNSLFNIQNLQTFDKKNLTKLEQMDYANCYDAIDLCFKKNEINLLAFFNNL